MREIKFRAYVTEEMVKSQWLTGFGVMLIEMSDDYAEKTGKKKEVFLYTESGTFEVFEDSIGQYTGLKDKNGVEIYEGDIYRYKYYFDSERYEYRHFVVEWDRTDIAYEGSFHGYNFDESYIEVIGNIYENPELLETKKSS